MVNTGLRIGAFKVMRDIFKEEKKLYRQGYKCVAGVDEAGRGPLAGPIVASAVLILGDRISSRRSDLLKLKKIKDSKKLSEKQREEWYQILTTQPALEWAVASVYPRMIDRINIFEADKLAMRQAVMKLQKRLETCPERRRRIDCLIIDGNFYIYDSSEIRSRACSRSYLGRLVLVAEQRPVVKADEKVFLCMAASIIAKVTRDRIMKKAHEKYPQYGFDKHKGYGTRSHFEAIKKYGPCEIHRKSFEPIRSGCQNHTRLLTKNQAYDILPIRSRKRRDLKIFLK